MALHIPGSEPLVPSTQAAHGNALSSHTHLYLPHPPVDGHAQSDPPLPLSVGRYMLIAEVARGGMGVIYRGRESVFNRELAVKALLPAHAEKPEFVRRAWTEARVTALLEHPGVVPVHSVGTLPDGRPYFSMRLVNGQTLADLMRQREGPADSLPQLLKVFEQVCQTMAYAHTRGVIHRDIKPSNVLVAPFGVVKVIDWGVAKVLPDSPIWQAELEPPPSADPLPAECSGITRYGVVLGTVDYMAPEQVRGDSAAVDTRADVFALGGLLCHLLTGHPPYTGDSFLRILERATAADLYEARGRLDVCGADVRLIRLAKACLAANPEDRPFDARVLADTLTGLLESSLQQAERDLTRFFELSLDLFCIAGLDGFFKRVNDNFRRVLGHSTADLLRHPFRHYVHPDDWPATEQRMGDLQSGRPVVRFRNRYRDARGEYRLFEWTAKAVPEEGTIFAVARDVTAGG